MRFGKVGKFAHLAPAKRCKFASHPAVRSAGIPAVSGDAKPRARGAETTSHIATRYFLAGRRAVPLARLAARCSAAGLFGSGNSADFRQITSLRLGSEIGKFDHPGNFLRWSEESLIMAMLW